MNVSWGASYWGFNANLPALRWASRTRCRCSAVSRTEPVADLGADQLRRDDLPVPAVPGVHQLHQPHAARVEPRPAGCRVVRRGQRAAPRAAERDPRDARAHGGVPVLPELQRAAALPRHDRQQAEPRRHRLVRDRDGAAHLDDARRERDARPLPPAAISCATRPSARRCRGSASSGWSSRCGSTSSRWSSRSRTASKGSGKLHYLETNGILDALLFYAIGVVIYVVMRIRAAAGVDTKMLFTEIPPD